MIRTELVLEKFSELSPFFWNALFVILYEPKRKEIPVDNGYSTISLTELTYASKSTIHDYLACKRPLPYNEFVNYCNAINEDIYSPNFEALKLGNIALEYLQTLFDDRKLNTKGTHRKATITNITFHNEDEFTEAQTEHAWDYIEQTILEQFKDLSCDDLTYLYQIADVLTYATVYVTDFVKFYTELNETGRMLFKEALNVESAETSALVDDEATALYGELSQISKTAGESSLSVTPEMLVNKLGHISRYSPEYASELRQYLSMDMDAWNTLIDFHKIISALSESNIPDYTFSERQSLLLCLNWLWNLPSLKTTK